MSESLIEIKKLTKVYGSGITKNQNNLVALQDFELTIPKNPAKIIAIAGESGSGKSTLANLVLGFIRANVRSNIVSRAGIFKDGSEAAYGL